MVLFVFLKLRSEKPLHFACKFKNNFKLFPSAIYPHLVRFKKIHINHFFLYVNEK